MALIRRVRAVWTSVAGTPYYSNFYFTNAPGTPGDMGAAVGNLFGGLVNFIRTGVAINVEQDIPLIDSVTGDIQSMGTWQGVTLNGADPTEALPPADQILARWRTDAYVGGRRLDGRFFLGALTQTVNDAGQVGAPQRAVLAGDFQEFIDNPAIEPCVWSRKTGATAAITSVSLAPYFAVLRSRRD